MINSWSVPFLEAFRKSKGVHLYQVIYLFLSGFMLFVVDNDILISHI